MKDAYINEIEKVSRVMNAHGLTHVAYSDGSFSLSLVKGGAQNEPVISVPHTPIPAELDITADREPPTPQNAPSGGEEVKSPMVGVFYNAPSPEAEPFVRIGDTVKKGDVLCILEAMKLMNEITAEHDGKITDICAKNGDVVEFGQVLFKIEANG